MSRRYIQKTPKLGNITRIQLKRCVSRREVGKLPIVVSRCLVTATRLAVRDAGRRGPRIGVKLVELIKTPRAIITSFTKTPKTPKTPKKQ
jgi:hypothetical protein